eukprot:7766316-Pyramimonas_sp.AAC.1
MQFLLSMRLWSLNCPKSHTPAGLEEGGDITAMRLYPSRNAASIRKQRKNMEEEELTRDQRATKE